MEFFAQFFAWINAQILIFVSSNTARIAIAIEPAAITLATIYVMIWGFASLTGRIQEPIWEGVKRITMIGLILGFGLRLWVYNEIIVDTFLNAPDQLAATVIGAPQAINSVDQIWLDGAAIAEQLLKKGSILDSDFAFYAAGFLVYLIVGLAVVVTAFMIALSKVALAILLAIGPLFMIMLFFDATKRFFESWIAQLVNYALINLLTIFSSALLLSMLKAYVSNASSSGTEITIAESARVCMAAALVFLVMRQVMPIAASLASGVALSTYGVISGAVRWGMGSAQRSTYEFGRGLLDGARRDPGSKWDSLRRLAGNRVGTGLAGMVGSAAGIRRGGTVIPREQIMPGPNNRQI